MDADMATFCLPLYPPIGMAVIARLVAVHRLGDTGVRMRMDGINIDRRPFPDIVRYQSYSSRHYLLHHHENKQCRNHERVSELSA